MKNYVLFAHSGSYNHGCEAIVRSTLKVLSDGDSLFRLFSDNPDEDIEFGLSELAEIKRQKNIKALSLTALKG